MIKLPYNIFINKKQFKLNCDSGIENDSSQLNLTKWKLNILENEICNDGFKEDDYVDILKFLND